MKAFIVIITLIIAIIGLTFWDSNQSAIEGVLGISTHNTPTLEATPKPIYEPTNTLTDTPTPYLNTSQPLIDCTGPDGKHLQVTQKQCDDFNAAWGNASNSGNGIQCEIIPGQYITVKDETECEQARTSFMSASSNSGSMTNQPTVSCVLSWGTFQITQTECDQEKAIDAQSQNTQNTQYYYPTYATPTPLPTIDYSYQNSQCKQNALNTYQAAQQYAMGMYGGGSSAGAALIKIAQAQYIQAVTQCDAQYPIH